MSSTLTLTLTSSPTTASRYCSAQKHNGTDLLSLSSRWWTGKEFSRSLPSLEQRRSRWTIQDSAAGSPTGSSLSPTKKTRSRLSGLEGRLGDLGPRASVPSACCCARQLSYFGSGGEETNLRIFYLTSYQSFIHAVEAFLKKDQQRKIIYPKNLFNTH